MYIFNRLFYFVLFIGLFLPSNTQYYFNIFGAQVTIREFAFIILPFINAICRSHYSIDLHDNKIKSYIIIFISIVLLTEISKVLIYGSSLSEVTKGVRLGIPLLSSLYFVAFGIRANVKKVWKTFLLAIIVSVIISIITIFINIPIYGNLIESGQNIISSYDGRIINANASFGMIAIYLLFTEKRSWYNHGKLPLLASTLSVISLVLSFSRTYYVALILAYIYLTFKVFKSSTAYKFILIPVMIGITIMAAYNLSPFIQRQVDWRILPIYNQEITIGELTFTNNRDFIYNAVINRVMENYWVVGMPMNEPIFIWTIKDDLQMNLTDTSIVNILLRYGIIPLMLMGLIYYRILKDNNTPLFQYSFFVFLLVSWNVDSLFYHNSVYFLFLILMVTQVAHNEKYVIRNENILTA